MAIKLFWSKRADQGYARIVKYLEEEWTDKEVQNFVRETKHFFELLQQNPYILVPSETHKDLYRGAINRLTILLICNPHHLISTSKFNKLIFNGVHHETCGVFALRLIQDICPVFLYSAFADKQPFADFEVGQSFTDQ